MKKVIFIFFIIGILIIPVAANSTITSIYFQETDSTKIISQLYDNKNVETYTFNISNAVEDSHIDIIYYIDDEIIKTDNNVVVFKDQTSYFVIGKTLEKIILRTDKRIKSKKYGQKNVSKIDENYSQALQSVKYIRKDKNTVMNDDLIIQFESLVNNHKYRIDFKYVI